MDIGLASAIEDSSWFRAGWTPYLLLDTDLRIRAVNRAYEKATFHPREQLLGRVLFDVFPDNPAVPDADGVANLSASLDRVFRQGQRDWMGAQRYDVPHPPDRQCFVHKVWAPVNSPIKRGGRTVAALHHVQDVTAVLARARSAVPPSIDRPGLEPAAHRLARRFPDVPIDVVLGTLTHAYLLVTTTAGVADVDRAVELAALRLEIRTGHPPLPLTPDA